MYIFERRPGTDWVNVTVAQPGCVYSGRVGFNLTQRRWCRESTYLPPVIEDDELPAMRATIETMFSHQTSPAV